MRPGRGLLVAGALRVGGGGAGRRRPRGSGFRGSSFHCVTDSRDAVDEVMRAAAAAGGTVVKEAAAAGWGGYFGYFSDPDGYLWKVTTAA
ncbi:VOC family protein [Nonomuraea terrae]|nr:VOC family protein [Nonomuraea terrae]